MNPEVEFNELIEENRQLMFDNRFNNLFLPEPNFCAEGRSY